MVEKQKLICPNAWLAADLQLDRADADTRHKVEATHCWFQLERWRKKKQRLENLILGKNYERKSEKP